MKVLIAALILAVVPVAASAQDPIVALNPTTMVGYAGTVAAGEYAKKQYGGQAASVGQKRQVRSICTNLDWYAARPRATPAKMARMRSMCRQAGY